MPRLANWITTARGWRRCAIAILAGLLGALVLAPVSFGIALVVPMVVAVWLIDTGAAGTRRRAWRRAFADGWLVGFGYHLAGFWWLGAAFLIDPDFTWALPLGVLGVPALLAVFTAAGFVLARLLWVPGPWRVLALALGLAATEWARGHWFSGFPWNSFGMALGGTLVPAQLASIVGQNGLDVVAVAIAAAPATLADGGDRPWRATALAALALAAVLTFGAIRLALPRPAPVAGVTVRLVQPGLRPDEKFTYANKEHIVDDYLALSSRRGPTGTTLDRVTMLVWPESPFPFILTREPDVLARIGALLAPGTSLVTGAAREEPVPAADGVTAHSDYYNSILVIGAGGRILGHYDKVHLVPFGEYLPLDGLLRRLGLRNFVEVPGGFTAGGGHHDLAVPGLPPAAPLVCYEAIFPGEVVPPTGAGSPPHYLLNITNDGWFGTTSGPWQHLALARLRAIEEGLPLIRGAATGISAFVDADGRILQHLDLGRAGILDGELAGHLAYTVYARCPVSVTLLVALLTFVVLLYRTCRRG